MNTSEKRQIEVFITQKEIYNLNIEKKDKQQFLKVLGFPYELNKYDTEKKGKLLDPDKRALFWYVCTTQRSWKQCTLDVLDKAILISINKIKENKSLSEQEQAHCIFDLFDYGYKSIYHPKSIHNRSFFAFYEQLLKGFEADLKQLKEIHEVRSKARAKRKFYPVEYLHSIFIKECPPEQSRIGGYDEKDYLILSSWFNRLYRALPRKLQRNKKDLFIHWLRHNFYKGWDNGKNFEKAISAFTEEFIEHYKGYYDLIDVSLLPQLLDQFRSSVDTKLEVERKQAEYYTRLKLFI